MTVHTTLYRKYRPQAFEDVIGQARTVSLIEAALKQGSTGHAYLFYGGRGTGKTSLARIFARELGVQSEDMYEIDAASHTGVDHIRELNESTSSLPFNSPYKVYIIDEVHMLSKSAFNALLKTLEEPPAHVIFMLATTELDKVLDTIISRCQVMTLDQPSVETLRELITHVTAQEGIKLSPAAATTIALLGEGSFRDTLGVLQKVITVSTDKELTDEEIQAVTGAPQMATTQAIMSAIGGKDLESALATVGQLGRSGVSAQLLVAQLLHYGRWVLMLRFHPTGAAHLEQEVGPDMAAFLKSLAGTKGAHLNAAWVARLITIAFDTKRSHLSFLPLELGLIEHLS